MRSLPEALMYDPPSGIILLPALRPNMLVAESCAPMICLSVSSIGAAGTADGSIKLPRRPALALCWRGVGVVLAWCL